MKRKMSPLPRRRHSSGFSLVEVLAAITIIGVVIFLAIPNIVQIRRDAEESLAKSRAEALNVAVAAYFQSVGPEQAQAWWTSNSDTSTRYSRITPYLAFAPATYSGYMPKDYFINFSSEDPHRVKATLTFSNALTNRTIAY
jgi:prepilin-type N-terminal cleavage/methylation domain-containing protein